MRQTWEVLIPSSSVNTTPELRIFILISFLRFSRRFPQINVGGDSAHLSSFGKRTREPCLHSPAKGHVATASITYLKQTIVIKYCEFKGYWAALQRRSPLAQRRAGTMVGRSWPYPPFASVPKYLQVGSKQCAANRDRVIILPWLISAVNSSRLLTMA